MQLIGPSQGALAETCQLMRLAWHVGAEAHQLVRLTWHPKFEAPQTQNPRPSGENANDET